MTHLPRAGELARWCAGFASLAIIFVLLGKAGHADDPHQDLTRLSPTEELWVDFKNKEVIIGGRIAVARGAIELVACPRGTKEHESIAAVNASPRLVHAGLLALGLEPGSPARFAPDFVAASGPVVQVLVRWRDPAGKPREADAREWVREARTGRAMNEDWVFAGGSFRTDPAGGKVVMLGDGADLICVCNFPESMLDLKTESSSENDRRLFEAFEGRVPPRGTKVEVILRGKNR